MKTPNGRIGTGAGAKALRDVVATHRRGEPLGIYSVCSAHPAVLEAAMDQARADGSSLLIESTSNQVNPEGGYTGQTPAGFVRFLEGLAQSRDLPAERVILGGDHLGPFPWQGDPAAVALDKARALVRACVLAGYEKIHLDASMACADDPGGAGGPLDERTVVERSADLAAVAEAAWRERGTADPPVYVIGTEVPTPGGEQQDQEVLTPTRPENAERFLSLSREAFTARGLEAAWERVIALVVQPGVEFGDTVVHDYQAEAARPLRAFLESRPGLVFEAHSTDYQTERALAALVLDHFAILKVGPALTFAYREAVFALARIEDEWLTPQGVEPSGLRAALEAAMLARPGHWSKHYRGTPAQQSFARAFSLSDRIRYYWTAPEAQTAVARLFANLSQRPIPQALLTQYLPEAAEAVRAGALPGSPLALARHRVRAVTEVYARACGMAGD